MWGMQEPSNAIFQSPQVARKRWLTESAKSWSVVLMQNGRFCAQLTVTKQ